MRYAELLRWDYGRELFLLCLTQELINFIISILLSFKLQQGFPCDGSQLFHRRHVVPQRARDHHLYIACALSCSLPSLVVDSQGLPAVVRQPPCEVPLCVTLPCFYTRVVTFLMSQKGNISLLFYIHIKPRLMPSVICPTPRQRQKERIKETNKTSARTLPAAFPIPCSPSNQIFKHNGISDV